MTKDYEVDRIEEEVRRDVEAEVARRMQSPYTRAEFVAREVEAGIDAQGIPGVHVHDLDPDAMTAIRQRAEWNARAAERAGITWRVDNICPTCRCNRGWERCINGRMCLSCSGFMPDTIIRCPECDELCQSFDLDGRGVCMKHGVVERPTVVGEPTRINTTDKSLVDWLAERVEDLESRVTDTERRENLHVRAVGELSGRVRAAETEIAGLNNGQIAAIDVEQRQVKLRHELAARVDTLERSSSALRDRVLGDYEIDDDDEYTPVLDRLADLANRMSTANARITATEKAIRGLEQQVAQTPQPIVAEIRDPTGARTVYHAIEERVKDEIRMLILEEIGHLTEEVIQPASETIGELSTRIGILEQQIDPSPLISDHDRRLSLQLERITELDNRLGQLYGQLESVRKSLYGDGNPVFDTCGIWEVVRRLDADMALVRDAICPPQGGTVQPTLANPSTQFEGQLPTVDWPDPTPTMLESSVFEAIWQTIKTWDIAVPGAYSGYTSATGNHVRAILDGVKSRVYSQTHRDQLVDRLGKYAEHLRQTRDALRTACLELGTDATWSDDTSLADVVSKVLLPHILHQLSSRHDDLAYALGRAYIALKDFEPYEPRIVDEEMEAIRTVLGNNYRDWLRPRAGK